MINKAPAVTTKTSLSICLVSHGHLCSNSGQHVYSIAKELAGYGYRIALCIPRNSEQKQNRQEDIDIFSFNEYLDVVGERPPVLVHLWTPRESIRKFYLKLISVCTFNIPYIVHLEDNEMCILQEHANVSAQDIKDVMLGKNTIAVPDHCTHPLHGKLFIENANGLTSLISSLTAALPASQPKATFWPGFDASFAVQRSADELSNFRSSLNLPDDVYITAYTGNVHQSNVEEVRSLYIAVALVNRMGVPLKLIRTGKDFVSLSEHGDDVLHKHTVELGIVSQGDLPKILQLTDILIQPGKVDEWNSYRVPSKLPEYLISGRPVILPEVNLGKILKNNEEALILNAANAEQIAAMLIEWLPRKRDRALIGLNGAKFAKKHLNWSVATKIINDLYFKII